MKLETQKIQDFLNNLDEKQRYYFFAGILVFIFLLDYLILMRPQLNKLWKINSDIKVIEQELSTAKNDIQKEAQYYQQVKQLKEQVKQSNLKVKSKEEVPLILEKISRLANNNGIKIDQIMPVTEEQESLLEDKGTKYYSLPINVEARGGYHDFGRFMNELERGDIFLGIKKFLIYSSEDPRAHHVRLTLNAVVYERTHAEVVK